jgi:hypothetical protein
MYPKMASAMDEGGMTERRQSLLAGLTGEVIEVGAGHGGNFAHYPAEVARVVAAGPEQRLREQAQGCCSPTSENFPMIGRPTPTRIRTAYRFEMRAARTATARPAATPTATPAVPPSGSPHPCSSPRTWPSCYRPSTDAAACDEPRPLRLADLRRTILGGQHTHRNSIKWV